ncbi:unnamed protein product [Allacma fusca]|uniref:Uncharacterized protein n=1 Tax=Allacma fusca TaxID=39272 RepID=A0A8J2K5A9_9HEXA|nr:unnamed protein product [Allacma fusca]
MCFIILKLESQKQRYRICCEAVDKSDYAVLPNKVRAPDVDFKGVERFERFPNIRIHTADIGTGGSSSTRDHPLSYFSGFEPNKRKHQEEQSKDDIVEQRGW